MKRVIKNIPTHYLLLNLVCCLTLSSCLVKMSESESDIGAGTNGGFEKVKNNLPLNWMVNTRGTTGEGDFVWIFDSTDFKEGVQSYKCEVLSCSNKGGRFSPGIAQEFPANEGDKFRLKFWIKQQQCAYRINITGVSATESSAGPFLQVETGTNDWKQFEYEYTIPSGRKALRVEFSLLSQGTWWIDGLTLEKINPS